MRKPDFAKRKSEGEILFFSPSVTATPCHLPRQRKAMLRSFKRAPLADTLVIKFRMDTLDFANFHFYTKMCFYKLYCFGYGKI